MKIKVVLHLLRHEARTFLVQFITFFLFRISYVGFKIFKCKVAKEFETAVSILNEFADFSSYNLWYDKEYYIRIY